MVPEQGSCRGEGIVIPLWIQTIMRIDLYDGIGHLQLGGAYWALIPKGQTREVSY